ncbi:hypothetical protein OVA24_14965 [Luteolibacter sp. SL250]|uniref:hypothetical protein n=1 Tax=Luteolibacter sp. SL250 TaxID=2995170 RepID=UPI002272243F|nr:hypothetical protein [Luteolibacter sp. SL250]WAC18534.1 hypothetical protein OVA24_14965 [Luteolibacter sp. SL250]
MSGPAPESAPSPAPPRPSVREPRTSGPAPATADLLQATRPREGSFGEAPSTGISVHIANWTDEEILTALEEAARMPDTLRRYDSIASLLLAEYTRRDPDRALAWAMAQPPILSRRFAQTVIATWPPDRVDDAIAFVRKNPDLFGNKLPVNLIYASFAQAAEHGPAALISRMAELKEDGIPRYSSYSFDFPAGFDFAALLGSSDLKSLDLPRIESAFLRAWLNQDREGAFDWVLRNSGPAALIKLGPSQFRGNGEHPRWLVGKLETLTPGQRAAFFEANSSSFLQPGWNSVAWINSAKQPEMKDALRSAAAQGIFIGLDSYVDRGLQALSTLPDGESRLRALETLEPKGDRTPLQAGAAQILRRQLAEWGADAARTDAIIARLKEKTKPTGDP